VQLNAAGQIELKLKTRWRDGTTHLVMSPLEFMQRPAALVPRPRLHLIRFHGVLAPNARLRSLVVPQGPPNDEEAASVTAAGPCAVESAQARPGRISWAQLLKRIFDIDAALSELRRRRAQDHRGHPGAAGDPQDPGAPGAGSAAAAQGPGARGGAALRCLSGARHPIHIADEPYGRPK
jgi:hypothetical protein